MQRNGEGLTSMEGLTKMEGIIDDQGLRRTKREDLKRFRGLCIVRVLVRYDYYVSVPVSSMGGMMAEWEFV